MLLLQIPPSFKTGSYFLNIQSCTCTLSSNLKSNHEISKQKFNGEFKSSGSQNKQIQIYLKTVIQYWAIIQTDYLTGEFQETMPISLCHV